MRSSYHIPVFKPADDGIEPWLNLGNAAKLLKIAPKTLRLAAEAARSKPSIRYRTAVDLRPHLADNNCCSIYRRTSTTEPETPRGIAPQSAKSLLFNNIDRWVF